MRKFLSSFTFLSVLLAVATPNVAQAVTLTAPNNSPACVSAFKKYQRRMMTEANMKQICMPNVAQAVVTSAPNNSPACVKAFKKYQVNVMSETNMLRACRLGPPPCAPPRIRSPIVDRGMSFGKVLKIGLAILLFLFFLFLIELNILFVKRFFFQAKSKNFCGCCGTKLPKPEQKSEGAKRPKRDDD